MNVRAILLSLCVGVHALCALGTETVHLEAERPLRQQGSLGKDTKRAASGGEVLGREFGARAGHFATYRFKLDVALAPAEIAVRYARDFDGVGRLRVDLDKRDVGYLAYEGTGGWGDDEASFREAVLRLESVGKGEHELRVTVEGARIDALLPRLDIRSSPVLDLVGRRSDKSSVGHGKNVAVYSGQPSRLFYSTYELGSVFSAADGGVVVWYPDHVVVTPEVSGSTRPNVNLDRISIRPSTRGAGPAAGKGAARRGELRVLEQRRVCVTSKDVVVSEIFLHNPSGRVLSHRVDVRGDCRGSHAWRGGPGGDKLSRRAATVVLVEDHNVFPSLFEKGLTLAVGANAKPAVVETEPPGTYRLAWDIQVPAGSSPPFRVACAIHPDGGRALRNLWAALGERDVVGRNRQRWARFYAEKVPRFQCSDPGLEELYAFRWFLLRFSTTGGDLGYLEHPVVLEGRQAYQTYCCYSAPFMAFDLAWAVDPKVGYGHLASMTHAAYDDGRFPWYTAPDTNEVPLHHRSRTGLSLLPHAAWKHYLVHGRKKDLINLYAGLERNVEWWIRDRDADGDGLFVVDHQLETGMDDLLRWPDPELRYEAVDATSYAYANIRAVAEMARVLQNEKDHRRLDAYARKTASALNQLLWDADEHRWRDRHPTTGELSPLLAITTFYPFFAGVGGREHLGVFREHLLSPERFWLPHPVPALARDQPGFGPRKFWQGPSWPAATSHVIEAFVVAAQRHDESLLTEAAELLRRAARNHLRPRADFHERYDPLTGDPLSGFRDYMHSWWIDILLRHVAGMRPGEDRVFDVEPLPMGLGYCVARGLPYHGHAVDIEWSVDAKGSDRGIEPGLTVRVDGVVALRDEGFEPGKGRATVEVD